MSEVVMRVGRVCPICKRDGSNGQSVVQVHGVGGSDPYDSSLQAGAKSAKASPHVKCPECGTTWKVGETHKDPKQKAEAKATVTVPDEIKLPTPTEFRGMTPKDRAELLPAEIASLAPQEYADLTPAERRSLTNPGGAE